VAAAAAVIVGGVLWITSLGDRTPPAEPTPAARVDERPASPPPAVTPPPAIPAPAPAPVVDAERVLQDQLTRIDAAYRKGDLEGALVEMRPVLARTTDTRARTLARTIASDARSTMTTAAAAARKQKAATLSPVAFGTAERARAASEDAFNRNDFVEAGIQALRASANYSFAEREAAVAAAKVVTPPPAAPRTADIERAPTPSPGALPTPSAAPAVVVANPPPAPVPVPQPPPVVSLPQPPPAAAPTPAAAAPPARASAIEIERAGIVRALNRYQDAYRSRSIKDLQNIYPSLPREERQALDRSFSRVCRAVDFTYLNPQFGLNADDPTSATVTTRTTFTCQPGTGQKPEVVSGSQVFLLRKAGDSWLIDRIITDPSTR
jgi:hypothetical protein